MKEKNWIHKNAFYVHTLHGHEWKNVLLNLFIGMTLSKIKCELCFVLFKKKSHIDDIGALHALALRHLVAIDFPNFIFFSFSIANEREKSLNKMKFKRKKEVSKVMRRNSICLCILYVRLSLHFSRFSSYFFYEAFSLLI